MNIPTTKFTFNKIRPKITPTSFNPSWESFSGQKMFKYAALKVAYRESLGHVRGILDSCPFVGGFKHKLVDVKIHSLQEGECPCIFGWHLDGHPNPFHYPKPSIYHLFLLGPEHSRTLFIDEPVELEVLADKDPKKINDDYVKQLKSLAPKYIHAPEASWVTFTSEDFHSGPVMSKPANRILVRVAETDYIEPRNSETKEAFKQRVPKVFDN